MAMSELFHVSHCNIHPFLRTQYLEIHYQAYLSTIYQYHHRIYPYLRLNTQDPYPSYQIKKMPHRRHSRSTFIEILVVERTTLTRTWQSVRYQSRTSVMVGSDEGV
jgi:hypothetical protein